MTAATDALQAALAGEHAATYGYGVVGARLDKPQQPAALDALARHRQRRDTLAAQVRARGVVPVAAEPAYDLPFPVRDANAARRLAALVEDRLVSRYIVLLGADEDRRVRRVAVAAAQESAAAAVTWRLQAGDHSPGSAFPGR